MARLSDICGQIFQHLKSARTRWKRVIEGEQQVIGASTPLACPAHPKSSKFSLFRDTAVATEQKNQPNSSGKTKGLLTKNHRVQLWAAQARQ